MKSIIIGLAPFYKYPGKLEEWNKKNTKYASNFGACLISNSLIKQFNGEYFSEIEKSEIKKLRSEYDQVILAMATHITDWRDVSMYTKIVRELDMPTYAFSLGVQDYTPKVNQVGRLHRTVRELLKEVLNRSKYIGVRGHYTASLLYRDGFENVVPIGCPTMYWNLNDQLEVQKLDSFNNPLIVYHRELIDTNADILKNVDLLGQDFLDEAIFTKNLDHDISLQNAERGQYYKKERGEEIIQEIEKNGIFPKDFNDWFNIINKHDFIFGARLHGCIAGIIQKKPAILYARDLRVREIAEFFKLPHVLPPDLKGKSFNDLFHSANYEDFNKTYKLRYANYFSFLKENNLESNLAAPSKSNISYRKYSEDMNQSVSLLYQHISGLQEKLYLHIENQEKTWPYRVSRLKKRIKDSIRYRIPFMKKILK